MNTKMTGNCVLHPLVQYESVSACLTLTNLTITKAKKDYCKTYREKETQI
jgi:hypothetical protein